MSGLSDCSDDSPELAGLEQPTDTLITSGGTDPRTLCATGSSTGCFLGTTGHRASGAAGCSTDGAIVNMAGIEDPAPQQSEVHKLSEKL